MSVIHLEDDWQPSALYKQTNANLAHIPYR